MLTALQEAPARISRGWERVRGRQVTTESHRSQALETETSLGLMAAAAATPGGPSDEQRIFLASSAVGMRARVAVLLGIPNRSKAQENELHMIERELSRLEGRPAHSPMRGLLGAMPAANPLLGLLGSPAVWVAAAFTIPAAFGAVQTARLNHAKGDLRDARNDLTMAERALRESRAVNTELAHAVRAADLQSREAAEALEAERARAARAAARERRRQREIQNVLTHGEPPAWSLRDPDTPAAGAGPNNPTSDNP